MNDSLGPRDHVPLPGCKPCNRFAVEPVRFCLAAVCLLVALSQSTMAADFLTARIAFRALAAPAKLNVCERNGAKRAIVDATLPAGATEYRLAVRPNTAYVWKLAPAGVAQPSAQSGTFTSGSPRNDHAADDRTRYRNPRPGAHYQHMTPVPPEANEPLSPWYAVKRYRRAPPPTFEAIRDKLPEPIWDGHAADLEAYWYCWRTLCEVWSYAPTAPDHQAVNNLIGIRTWGPWGSTMVFDTAFITYFARYAHGAYPFIEGFDNCYARQHENGFICRESDRENREVYVIFPVNPPLFAWAEWENYRLSGDVGRLRAVLLPIVKHYEWWMAYQRRPNGLYWTNGAQEADDSPRNERMHFAVSATSYQALAALYLSRIARAVGRGDLAEFFDDQHRQLGETVNRHFWDAKHRLYNDLLSDGRFLTEWEPGKRCKHCHMFWPLVAEIVPADRLAGVVAELQRPETFARRNGVPSLSADSLGYTGGPEGHGQYWRGAVWPPIQCMVQEGLRRNGRWDLAHDFAERYRAAVVETFVRQRDITENLAPDRPAAHGVGKFVGWGGVGPVANLIEYTLGIEVDAARRHVEWRVTRPERHGLRKLRVGPVSIDLVCGPRDKPGQPRRVEITADGELSLALVAGPRRVEAKIPRGQTTLHLVE